MGAIHHLDLVAILGKGRDFGGDVAVAVLRSKENVVKRDTASKAQVSAGHEALRGSEKRSDELFEEVLGGVGDVAVPVGDVLARVSERAEQLDQAGL